MRRSTHWCLVAMSIAAVVTPTLLLLMVSGTRAVATAPSAVPRVNTRTVTDASSQGVPAGEYRRIVSSSSIADAILPEFVGTERIVGVSRWYLEANPNAARLHGKPQIAGPEDLERIIALNPDIVIVSNYSGNVSPLARLRERGIRLFDLGPMRGRATLESNYRMLGQLLLQSEHGEQLARQFQRRMAQVAAHIPTLTRKRAIYMNLYDTQLHGGTIGSSYHDVLIAAGLLDVAAEGHNADDSVTGAWPRFRPEQVLELVPEILVTVSGKGRLICDLPGLALLPACSTPNGIIELEAGLLHDPGPGMLLVAETICDRVYPTLATPH